MQLRWKIYYISGETFSNLDGEPADAPGWGVLAVVQEDEMVGVLVHQRSNFYCFDKQYGGWVGMDHFGLAQYIGKPGKKTIKLGEAMDTNHYKVMISDIKNNPELPTKSAHYVWENR